MARGVKSVKTLDKYSRLTIRILKAKIVEQNGDDGYGYRHLFTCDEIPECRGYGSSVSDALKKFQKLAELLIELSL